MKRHNRKGEPRNRGGEWCVAYMPGTGSVSGILCKRRGRWWFMGDVLRDVKIRVADLKKIGGSIQIP